MIAQGIETSLHILGYLIAILMLTDMMSARKMAVVIVMYCYSCLLFCKEIIQIIGEQRKRGSVRMYFKRMNNWIDLIAIIFTALAATLALVSQETERPMPWLGNLISIVILITWFQFCKDLMDCLPNASVCQNLNMFYHVSRTYLKMFASFAPFLLAFAHTFIGKKRPISDIFSLFLL